jgi:hypoxanthine phosphoribosyltransferase
MLAHTIGRQLFTAEQIHARIHTLIDEIAADSDTENLVMLGILRGSFIFLADLVRGFEQHKIHPLIDFITLSSYGSETVSSGRVEITHDTTIDLTGADVIVVDDILDSGRTLAFARDLFLQRGAHSVRTCVMLNKKTERAVEMEADYAGFSVENVFVVGYGLDYDNHYREMPYIAEVTFKNGMVE